MVKRNPEFINVHRITGVLVGQPLVDKGRFPEFLPYHVKIRHLLIGKPGLHDNDGRVCGRLRLWLGPHYTGHYACIFSLRERMSCGRYGESEEEDSDWKRHSKTDHGGTPGCSL